MSSMASRAPYRELALVVGAAAGVAASAWLWRWQRDAAAVAAARRDATPLLAAQGWLPPRLVEPEPSAAEVSATSRTPNEAAVQAFWAAAGWRRVLPPGPPDAVVDRIRSFVDEVAGRRDLIGRAATAFSDAALAAARRGGAAAEGAAIAAPRSDLERLPLALRDVLEHLDDPLWCEGRGALLSALAQRAEGLRQELLRGQPGDAPPRLPREAVSVVLGMAESLCLELWEVGDYAGGARPRRVGSRLSNINLNL